MSEPIIRSACVDDAERLVEIYSYYVEKTAVSFEYTTPSVDEFRSRMEKIMKKYPYLVVESDGVICGYAYAGSFVGRAAYDWSCELTIYLDHECRGRGFGRLLYTELEKRLKDMGITNMYACIGAVEPEDEYLTNASPRFHERMGFTLAGTFHKCGKKFGRWYDMIWMEKIINEHA